MFKKILLFCSLFFLFYATFSYALTTGDKFIHPFYIGIMGGYGSTTWEGLVPPNDKKGVAMLISTPVETNEGGGLWGVVAGYELIPTFALEGSYNRYPNAKVMFDPNSYVTYKYNGLTSLTTRTESISFMGKFMVPIPHTDIRAYSSGGAARVHRQDQIKECWHIGPTFGLGLNYNFTNRIMGEIGFNYTGGYGESETDPVEDYVPFLYSSFIQLAYRFG